MLAGSTAENGQEISRVLMLLNMVTHDELLDRDAYEGMTMADTRPSYCC